MAFDSAQVVFWQSRRRLLRRPPGLEVVGAETRSFQEPEAGKAFSMAEEGYARWWGLAGVGAPPLSVFGRSRPQILSGHSSMSRPGACQTSISPAQH